MHAPASCQCPECGERPAVVQPLLVDHVEHFTVVCARCGAQGPICATDELAQAAWNRLYRRSVAT